jgi:hypothetical protein
MSEFDPAGPSPDATYPLPTTRRLVFLKNIITNPNIIVGDYTYYDDFEDPARFERNVRYHFDFVGDRLIIGKFCSLASDITFIVRYPRLQGVGLCSLLRPKSAQHHGPSDGWPVTRCSRQRSYPQRRYGGSRGFGSGSGPARRGWLGRSARRRRRCGWCRADLPR